MLGWSAPVSALGSAATFPGKTAFADVSCASASSCTAVGSYGSWVKGGPLGLPEFEPAYAIETAGVWGKAIVLRAPNGNGVFTGVSCTSTSDCTAVGFEYSGQTDVHGTPYIGYPFYATETAGKWSSTTAITTATGEGFTSAEGAGFNSVSCASSTDCTAVGIGPVYATESAGTWGPATFVAPVPGIFTGISCTSATDCTAVGDDETCDCNYGVLVPNAPIAASEVAGVWGAAAEVLAPPGSTFNGVSCASATDCTAVGSGGSGGSPFYATESAGAWTPATEITMPGYGTLSGISCTAVTTCTAVGSGTDPAYGATSSVSALVTMAGGVWGPATVDGGGAFSKVSCTSATACTAVGSYEMFSGTSYAIDATENAGAWPAAPSPPEIGRVTPLNRSIKVAWAPPTSSGGSAVAGYIAAATLTTGHLLRQYFCSTSGPSCTIVGLTDGKRYSISVYAKNAVGVSASAAKRTASPRR